MNEVEIDKLHGSLESRSLEIKRTPPKTDKLVEIIQSGANGIEPVFRIVMGINENHDGRLDKNCKTPITFPLSVEGSKNQFENFDKYRQHLSSKVESQTEGYFEGLFLITEVPTVGGIMIVIDVPQSPRRPHQNTLSHRFYIRGDGQTRPMKQAEIKAAMEKAAMEKTDAAPVPTSASSPIEHSSATTYAIIESDTSIAETGIADIRPKPIPTLLPFGPGSVVADVSGDEAISDDIDAIYFAEYEMVMSLHLIPQTVTQTWTATELRKANGAWKGILPTLGRWCSASHSRNKYGFVLYGVSQNSPGVTNTLTQVFENGGVASILAYEPSDEKGKGCIPSKFLRERFALTLYGILQFSVMALGVAPPFDVVCNLGGVKGKFLALSGHPFIDNYETSIKDHIQSIILLSADDASKILDAENEEMGLLESHSVLKPFFKKVWDSCGVIWNEDISSEMDR